MKVSVYLTYNLIVLDTTTITNNFSPLWPARLREPVHSRTYIFIFTRLLVSFTSSPRAGNWKATFRRLSVRVSITLQGISFILVSFASDTY